MKSILFNSHDIVLTLVISLCIVLAIRPAPQQMFSQRTRALLTLFFTLNALVALDNLLFWGDAIKYAAFDLSPWLPLIFGFASFAVGPVLYWIFRSEVNPNWTMKPTDYLHLLPVLLTPFYLYWVCYQHPVELQRQLVLQLSIFTDPDAYFLIFMTLKRLLPVVYGVLCITLVFNRSGKPCARNPEATRALRLYAVFVAIWSWVLLTHILGQWLPLAVSDIMGVVSNYMSLVLIATLLFSNVNQQAPAPKTLENQEKPEESDSLLALTTQIEEFVRTEKPYLNPRLSLERFAAMLQVSSRQVSFAINRSFQQNFQEYINRFRIEEAKRLLRDPEHQQCTIVEIGQRAGFNSKATFNRFFKSWVGITPSAYRQNPELAGFETSCEESQFTRST